MASSLRALSVDEEENIPLCQLVAQKPVHQTHDDDEEAIAKKCHKIFVRENVLPEMMANFADRTVAIESVKKYLGVDYVTFKRQHPVQKNTTISIGCWSSSKIPKWNTEYYWGAKGRQHFKSCYELYFSRYHANELARKQYWTEVIDILKKPPVNNKDSRHDSRFKKCGVYADNIRKIARDNRIKIEKGWKKKDIIKALMAIWKTKYWER